MIFIWYFGPHFTLQILRVKKNKLIEVLQCHQVLSLHGRLVKGSDYMRLLSDWMHDPTDQALVRSWISSTPYTFFGNVVMNVWFTMPVLSNTCWNVSVGWKVSTIALPSMQRSWRFKIKQTINIASNHQPTNLSCQVFWFFIVTRSPQSRKFMT